jgi:predicted dehydrogenase
MPVEKIRWGTIGCGDVCEVKSGPGFQKASRSELVAVMRRRGDLAADYARRHGVPRWYDDAEALIGDGDVDAVYIATPTGFHMEYALKVAAAGKPAYVEKPMARTRAECMRMVEAFARAGQKLFVAYYRRALPRFCKARQLAAGGRLGRVTSVSYRYGAPRSTKLDPGNLPWRLVAEHGGGGLFTDLGCHTLDILDFILGPLTDVGGTAANLASPYDVEDTVAMHFRTESGALGTARWNFAAFQREDMIEITGTDGRVSLSTFRTEPVRLATARGVEEFDLANPEHVQQPLIQTVVDDLLGRAACPSTGQSAARTAGVIDTVLMGYYGSRDEGFWSDPQSWPGRRAR